MRFLMMYFYKQEMKWVEGNLERAKKVVERPKFKHVEVVTIQ
jgi:hypothetical protein